MKNIWKIIQISKPLHYLVLWLAGLIVFSSLLQLIAPILSKYIVDEIVAQIANRTGDLSRLWWLLGLSFGVAIVGVVLNSLSQRLGDHFAGKLKQFLTEKFYDHILRLPQSYFDSELSGKIVHQLNRGIAVIQNFMQTSSNFILPMLLQTVFTIVVLWYYNWVVSLLVLSLFPIYLTITYYSTKKWGEYEVEKNKHEDSSRGRIQEVISNIKLVKSFTNELQEWNLISDLLTKINALYAHQSRQFHIYDFIRNVSLELILLGVSVVVFYNTYQGALTIGEMVLILQLVNMARRPLFAMSFVLTQIQMAESGAKEFLEILDLEAKEEFRRATKRQLFKATGITFENVSFQYEENNQVLHDVSFNLRQNESVALVGHSGAGKSTLINLILKLYEPSSGRILMNGTEYSELGHRFVREHMALVLQENELFSTTIRENVSYGRTVTDKEVWKALKMANAEDFVKKLSKGLDSEVGERGVRLSGGQKQRIQIARAILAGTPVLILDEATSSLDSKSEREVQEALERLMKNKLVIIIAHRLSTIQNVDRILVINNGTIEDQGTPAELAKREGIYNTLLKYQVEGNKKLLENYDLY